MKSARELILPLIALVGTMLALDWGLRFGMRPATLAHHTQPATAFYFDFDWPYDTVGFSAPEKPGDTAIQWTWYDHPSIEVPLLPLGDAWVQFRIEGVVHPDFWENIQLEMNGAPLVVHRFGKNYWAYIPETALGEGRQTLVFHTPPPMRYNVANPSSLDWRLLGMAVDWLRAMPGPLFTVNCDLIDGCAYDGFTDVQPGPVPSRWTIGQAGITLPAVPGRALQAHVRIAEAVSAAALRGLRIDVNGVPADFVLTEGGDGSGAELLTVAVPAQADTRVTLHIQGGDSALIAVDGTQTRVSLRIESVALAVAPQDSHFYDFTGTQMNGLSELLWDGHSTYQFMVLPEARIVLPRWDGPAQLEIGVLPAPNEWLYDELSVAVGGQTVTLTRRTLLGREIYTGVVDFPSDQMHTEIVLRLPRLVDTESGRRGLALDWIQLKEPK